MTESYLNIDLDIKIGLVSVFQQSGLLLSENETDLAIIQSDTMISICKSKLH